MITIIVYDFTMSKRRISHQQSARIEKKQRNYRKPAETGHPITTSEGLVIKRFSRHAQIENDQGDRVNCSIRPTLGTLVAGDRVVWQTEGHGQGVVVSRYPRISVLGRPDKRGQLRPVAANITQVMIVVAPKPEISWPLLDSYLVMTEYLNLRACIVLNKTDLASDKLREELRTYYTTLDYPILFTGRDQLEGYKQLQTTLNNQTSVFVGQSGVGKSSLIAQVLPEESSTIHVAEISVKSELGCHTTSNSCFYHLPSGGALIDSPGVREFGLWHMPAIEIAKGFREFKPYLSKCKFRDCNHRDAPNCALLEAVKNKSITRQRYENYVKISTQFAK